MSRMGAGQRGRVVWVCMWAGGGGSGAAQPHAQSCLRQNPVDNLLDNSDMSELEADIGWGWWD